MTYPLTALVTVSDLTLETPHRVLIDGGSFSLAHGRRVGLVGRNGGGKTSLVDVLAAHCDGVSGPAHVAVHGSIRVAAGVSCGLLPQHPNARAEVSTVAEHLDASAGETAVLHQEHDALLASGLRSSGEIVAHADIVQRLSARDGWDYPERRVLVLEGLGLGSGDLQRPLRTLSGGESTRVALAGLLLAGHDLLLLDEPTNNLDLAGRRFLQEWMCACDAGILLVSHDRVLLDATVDEILEIDEETSTLRRYGGNHSFYWACKEEEFTARVRMHEEQIVRREALLISAGALRASAARFQTRSQNDYYRARGKKVARRAVVQRARVERELGNLEEPRPPRRPRIDLPHHPVAGGVLITARDVAVGHPGREPLVRGLDLTVHAGDRMAIAGDNGSGKSSLLRVLIGDLQPLNGAVKRARDCTVGYLPQSAVTPAPGVRVVDHARRVAPISEVEARELVGKVVFSDIADQPLARFSAGERRRIELAVFFASRPDVVLLDEPTNHLDLLTIDMLEEALDAYRGAILVVSHDTRFLERVAVRHRIELPLR
ncbi:MAG: ABC-F family ATP-binding cassette domain-containing protein [Candidatus Dormibacteria bacterium]